MEVHLHQLSRVTVCLGSYGARCKPECLPGITANFLLFCLVTIIFPGSAQAHLCPMPDDITLRHAALIQQHLRSEIGLAQ